MGMRTHPELRTPDSAGQGSALEGTSRRGKKTGMLSSRRNPGEARLPQCRVKKRLNVKGMEEMGRQREVTGASKEEAQTALKSSHFTRSFFQPLQPCQITAAEPPSL